jgi:hypothetical protein
MSSQSRSVSLRRHWTVPVRCEETLAVREKFRQVSWRPPNHKPCCAQQTGIHILVVEALLIAIYSTWGKSKYLYT